MFIRLYLAAAALLVTTAAYADEQYETATIVDFQQVTKLQNDTLGQIFRPGADNKTVDDYQQITVDIDDLRITARSYAIGGGSLYIANHPLEFVVGKEILATINERRGELRIQVESRKRPLRFKIERAEAIGTD